MTKYMLDSFFVCTSCQEYVFNDATSDCCVGERPRNEKLESLMERYEIHVVTEDCQEGDGIYPVPYKFKDDRGTCEVCSNGKAEYMLAAC